MHIQPDSVIKLPWAFEILQDYDHIYIDFPPTPVEGGNRRTPRRYYYFLHDVRYRAPSCTECIVSLDEWTTHMHDVQMDWIDLERGHAPLRAITPQQYLANPRQNCELLTYPDVNFGGAPSSIKTNATHIINRGEMWAVLVMTSDPGQSPGSIGQDDWRTPTTHTWGTQGWQSFSTIAIETNLLSGLMDDLETQAPQVYASIVACFLIPKNLCTVARYTEIVGRGVAVLETRQDITDMVTLSVDSFGYDDKYKGIAKLYTSPYADIEITDSEGRSQSVRIEDTVGRLRLSTVASLVYPLLGYDCYVLGIGDGSETALDWNAFDVRHLTVGGDWTSTLKKFSIPTYAVIQSPERRYAYSEYWSRVQRGAAIDESERQAKLGAATQKALQDQSFDRSLAKVSQVHDQQRAALTLSQTANGQFGHQGMPPGPGSGLRGIRAQRMWLDMSTDKGLAAAQHIATQSVTTLSSSQAYDRTETAKTRDTIGLGIAFAGLTIATGGLIATAGTAVAAGASVTSALGAGSGAAALAGFGGAVLGVMDQGFQLDSAVQEGSQQQAQYTLAATNDGTLFAASQTAIDEKMMHMADAQVAQDAITDQLAWDSLTNQQTYDSAITGADAALARSQATAAKALADNLADGSAALNRLSLATDYKAGKIQQPAVLASPGGDQRLATTPTAMSVRVRTQDRGALAAAGDQMLTYGYQMGGRQWRISTPVAMSHFTYWRGRIRLGRGQVTALTRETLSRIFDAGVTVWQNPNEIGTVSIYENGV